MSSGNAWKEFLKVIGNDPKLRGVIDDDDSPNEASDQIEIRKEYQSGQELLNRARLTWAHDHQVKIDTHTARMGYAERVFYLICIWITAVLVLVFLDGAYCGVSVDGNENVYLIDIESSVLIALITGLSVNVVGLFFVVLRWIYPNSQP